MTINGIWVPPAGIEYNTMDSIALAIGVKAWFIFSSSPISGVGETWVVVVSVCADINWNENRNTNNKIDLKKCM